MKNVSRELRASTRPMLLRSSPILLKAFYALPYVARRRLFATLRPSKFKRLQSLRTNKAKSSFAFSPFDKHQCIFVHIPKTAGISINTTLFGCQSGGHANVAGYQLIYSKDEFEKYFKFTFVRNPWDRLFSAYSFLARGGMTDMDARWAKHFLSPYRDFEDFVTRGLDHKFIWLYHHFVPQYEFLCLPHNKKILVDFIGYYENLQEDFEHVRNTLSLPDTQSLRQDNLTSKSKKDYRDFYTPKMQGIVAEVYREDIALLGYDFENTSVARMIAARSRGGVGDAHDLAKR